MKTGYCHICGSGNSAFGTKENKVTIMMPNDWETSRENRFFDIDSCMVPEISWLWRKGVRTIECCCGHGCSNGYIAVDEQSIPIMKKYGYINTEEKPERKDLFYPNFLHDLIDGADDDIRNLNKELNRAWEEIEELKKINA